MTQILSILDLSVPFQCKSSLSQGLRAYFQAVSPFLKAPRDFLKQIYSFLWIPRIFEAHLIFQGPISGIFLPSLSPRDEFQAFLALPRLFCGVFYLPVVSRIFYVLSTPVFVLAVASLCHFSLFLGSLWHLAPLKPFLTAVWFNFKGFYPSHGFLDMLKHKICEISQNCKQQTRKPTHSDRPQSRSFPISNRSRTPARASLSHQHTHSDQTTGKNYFHTSQYSKNFNWIKTFDRVATSFLCFLIFWVFVFV